MGFTPAAGLVMGIRSGDLDPGVIGLRFEKTKKDNRAAVHDLGLATANLVVEATSRGLFVHQMIGILPEKARELYENT